MWRISCCTVAAILFVFGTSIISRTEADESCLVSYDTNDTSIQLNLMEMNASHFRGEPGIPGKKGPVGPPGPIGGSENDTELRIRYDDKIAALEARLDALSDPSWFLATNGYRYKVFPILLDFEAAEEHCSHHGAHLATVGMRQPRTRDEIKARELPLHDFHTWVGLSDLQQRSRWKWSDGELSTNENTDWDQRSNEPNNSGGDERCAHMRSNSGHNWQLNDAKCFEKKFLLCEKLI